MEIGVGRTAELVKPIHSEDNEITAETAAINYIFSEIYFGTHFFQSRNLARNERRRKEKGK